MTPRDAAVDADRDATLLTPWLSALRRLDEALSPVLASSASAGGGNPFPGLSVGADEVMSLVAAPPTPGFPLHERQIVLGVRDCLEGDAHMGWLCDTFDLLDVDVAILLIAMAPELDLKYERIFAYLQDDLSQKCPSIYLCATLLASSLESRTGLLERFDVQAPLVRNALIRVKDQSPGTSIRSPLTHGVQVDAQIRNFLLHRDTLDDRLLGVCQARHVLRDLASVPLNRQAAAHFHTLIERAQGGVTPVQIYLRSDDSLHVSAIAAAIATACNTRCLTADWRALARSRDGLQLLKLLFREAWLRQLTLHIRDLGHCGVDLQADLQEALFTELATAPGVTLLSGPLSWEVMETSLSRVVAVECSGLDITTREAHWSDCLQRSGLNADPRNAAALAARFDLSATQIERAVIAAVVCPEPPQPLALQDKLFTAARSQTRRRMEGLAARIEPRHAWQDLVLPGDALLQLKEIGSRVTGRGRVMDVWGFDRKLSLGKGTSVLFSGPSGTGKTMAAEILAAEVGLDLYKIDLAAVVSKFIGETEQNLEKIFAGADGANAILFFDEADALFGKRSEVRDSHDRYANLEISYLLQRIERYNGVAILATNLRQNLDEAFLRRLAFIVNFPFPDAADRERIWRRVWPEATPIAPNADFEYLAKTFKLAGGNIKNVALAAAFLAAEKDRPVDMADLLHATRREYQKSGKTLSDSELLPRVTELARRA